MDVKKNDASTSKKENSLNATLAKLLTREILATRHEKWLPKVITEDFSEIKRSIEVDWKIQYTTDTTILRQKINSKEMLVEVTINKTGLLATLVDENKAAPDLAAEMQKKIIEERSGLTIDDTKADTGVYGVEYDPEKKGVQSEEMNIDGQPKPPKNAKKIRQVSNATFVVKLISTKKKRNGPIPNNIMIHCCLVPGSDEPEIQLVLTEFDDKMDTMGVWAIPSEKFLHKNEEAYPLLQKFLTDTCGINAYLGTFLFAFSVFQRRREKMQFLQGAKIFLEE